MPDGKQFVAKNIVRGSCIESARSVSDLAIVLWDDSIQLALRFFLKKVAHLYTDFAQ